jgi:hypothetical protein
MCIRGENSLTPQLVDTEKDAELEKERMELITEATELMKIFGSILQKSK